MLLHGIFDVVILGFLVVSKRVPSLEQFVAYVTLDAAMLDMAGLHVVNYVALQQRRLAAQRQTQTYKISHPLKPKNWICDNKNV